MRREESGSDKDAEEPEEWDDKGKYIQDDSSPFGGGVPGVDPPPGDAPTTKSASSEGRGEKLSRWGCPAPAAQVWALCGGGGGGGWPQLALAAATRYRARRRHSHRAISKAPGRPQPWPGCRLGRLLGRLGRLKPCLGELASISRAADAAPAQSRGASSPSTLLYYLLTTHSTEVAVDEAMYLVETSEAAFIGGDREEAAVEYKSIAEAMEDEIEGAGRTSTGSSVTSFPPFVVDTVASLV
eukprot:scaffold23708_cov63-Phaeocystis_antarctica.AAC.2